MINYNKIKYIIIPDVHGRTFWVNPVNDAISHNIPVIFLGDYVDPYPHEKINIDDAIKVFSEIINIKESNSELVTLLLGNHDVHYIDNSQYGCRMDFKNKGLIRNMIMNNFDCFEFIYTDTIYNKNFLFSHAGLLMDWVNSIIPYFPDTYSTEFIDFDYIKKIDWKGIWMSEKSWKSLYNTASYYRGGDSPFGSFIWADVSEHILSHKNIDCVQIFGHSQQQKNPVVKDNIYCLDCRQVFAITDEGNVVDENMNIIINSNIRFDY